MQLRNILRVASLKKIIAKVLIFSFFCSFLAPFSYAAPGDETTYYFLTDHLGSVDVILDEEGKVVEHRDYLPYGQERYVHEELNAPDTTQGFTGKELDNETGLNYYGARYYDSVTGRFISPDPLILRIDQMSSKERNEFLSDPQNLNAYTYAKNNPVKYVDPDGEIAILAALIVATAFIATFMSSYQNVAAPDINSPPIHTRSEPEILGSMAIAEVTGAVFGFGVGKVIQKVGQFGFKTIAQLKNYRRFINEGVEAKVAAERTKRIVGNHELTQHAVNQMTERQVGMSDVKNILENGDSFNYNYNGEIRKGYWSQDSKIFISTTTENKIPTVMKGNRVERYVEGLKNKSDIKN